MIICPLTGSSFKEALFQIELGKEADLFEVRLSLPFTEIKKLTKKFNKPFIVTIKSEDDLKLLSLNPDWIDVDYHWQKKIPEIRALLSQSKIIVSYHDFEKTPSEFPTIPTGIDLFKLACHAETIHDTLRLLKFTNSESGKAIGIAMGDKGEATRVLTSWTYSPVSLDYASAPGQISLFSIINDYKQKERLPDPDLYALIGDPVSKSISHRSHNGLMKELGWKALYLKFPVTVEELPRFMKEIKDFPLKGLSVTMPLKEAIIPFLDEVDEEARKIGAVNTVVVGKKTIGYNTDGLGAMDALKEKTSLKGKKMAILGKGGVARAIGWEAAKEGCEVVYLGRNPDPVEYDILVNATPVGMSPLEDFMPVSESFLLPGKIILDCVSNPVETLLIKNSVDCVIVTGYELFINQAARQFALWQEARQVDEEGNSA